MDRDTCLEHQRKLDRWKMLGYRFRDIMPVYVVKLLLKRGFQVKCFRAPSWEENVPVDLVVWVKI